MLQKMKPRLHERVKTKRVQFVAAPECALSLDEWLSRTRSAEAAVRAKAVGNACPCHLKRDVPEIWHRLVEMVLDDDVKVRSGVFHTLIDGSPRDRG